MITWAELNRDGHHAQFYEMLGVTYPVEDLEGMTLLLTASLATAFNPSLNPPLPPSLPLLLTPSLARSLDPSPRWGIALCALCLLLITLGIITPILFWSFVEMGVGFLVACALPSARIFDSIMSSKVVRGIFQLKSRRSNQGSDTASERSASETKFVYKSKSVSEGSFSDTTERSGANDLQQYEREMREIDSLG